MSEILNNLLWSLGTIILGCTIFGFIEESIFEFLLDDHKVAHFIAKLCYVVYLVVLIVTYWI